MAVAAYIPSDVRFEGRPIEGARLITLYSPDTEDRNGSMTTSTPLEAGTDGGPLVFVGRRDGKEWRVTLPRIVVRSRSALGFEYDIIGPPERVIVRENVADSRSKVQTGLGNLGATF